MTAEEREKLFTNLYLDAYPGVARYIARQGGSMDEAKDIFQDAVVIYYERLTGSGLQLKQTKEAYIFGIARHLWSRHVSKKQKGLPAAGVLYTDDNSKRQTLNILQLVEHTGKKCLDLLKTFYYDKQNMKEVAETFGFSGERSATVQKYKCLEKIREVVKEKALVYEDFAG
jgi:DNA-directed RNA polymerase specialized sigma24 family protein